MVEAKCIYCGKGRAEGVGVFLIHGRDGEHSCMADWFRHEANKSYEVKIPVSLVVPDCENADEALAVAREAFELPLSDDRRVHWSEATVTFIAADTKWPNRIR